MDRRALVPPRRAFELLVPLGYRLDKLTPRGVEFYPGWDAELETFVKGNYVTCIPQVAGRLPSVVWWNLPAKEYPMTVRDLLRPLPGVKRLSRLRQRRSFAGSAHYWERNYAHGGTSATGHMACSRRPRRLP